MMVRMMAIFSFKVVEESLREVIEEEEERGVRRGIVAQNNMIIYVV